MPEGDLPETIGGRYRTIRLIGRGAMGAVYEVEHVHTGERLALKLLLQSHRIDPVGVERFKREARASSRIKSPNVVRVTDADIAPEQGGAPFLVMELLEGADLEEVARTTKPAPAEVVGWLRQIARALDKAHGIGIIHRDLKPANVFLADGVDGGPPVVKILDFGLAKVVSDDRAQTRSGQILGTPMYMSPEQADPDGPPESPRSDLFSLGLIAFRLLVGDDYWGAGNVRQILTRILVEPMPPASQRGSSFGDAFDAWFAKACDREPSSRFASAHEMVEALAAALDVPVISRPASSDSSGARRPSRDPTLFEVAPTLNASVTSAPRITRASSSPLRVVIGVVAAALVGGLAWTALRHDPQTTAAPDAGPTSASPKAITDFPLPSSSVAEANSAYADALRAERNGANDDAVRLYERAVRLDPKLGAGHLRIVLLTMATGQPKARAHFHDAEASAATLDARDAAILDALRPLFLNEPPDVDGWAARFDSLARTRPDDAEIQVARAEVSNALGAFRDAAAAFGRALEADPLFGYASDRKYEMELYAGDVDAARATSAACRARASAVGRCPPGPEVFHSETCAEYAASMRARLSASPGSRERFGLAYALAATGAPRAAVDEALGQGRALLDDASARRRAELDFGARAAALYGDFDGAAKMASALEDDVKSSDDLGEHTRVARLRIAVAQERGEDAAAAQIAQAFLARRGAWQTAPWPDDGSLAHDGSGELFGIAHGGGRLDEPELDRWRTGWSARLRGGYRGYLWFSGFAAPATTREAAQRALAARAQIEPLPTHFPNTDVDGNFLLGRTLLLADRPSDAAAPLARAATYCGVLGRPFESTRARFLLGEANAAAGDTRGACAAYAKVLERWGHATPRSTTAERARARSIALRCDAGDSHGSDAASRLVAPSPRASASAAAAPPRASGSARGRGPLDDQN